MATVTGTQAPFPNNEAILQLVALKSGTLNRPVDDDEYPPNNQTPT